MLVALQVEGDLFADVIIAFFFRMMIQLFRSREAKSWPTVKGEITTATQRSAGCLTVELTCKGKLYTGTHVEPFLWANSLDICLEPCSPGNSIIIRVKPGEPESSFVRHRDSDIHPHGSRLESSL